MDNPMKDRAGDLKKALASEGRHALSAWAASKPERAAEAEAALRLRVDAEDGEGRDGAAAERVQAFLDRLSAKRDWKAVSEVRSEVLADFLKNEYPQTVALALMSLPGRKASKVLALLPTNYAHEVALRMERTVPVSARVEALAAACLREDLPDVAECGRMAGPSKACARMLRGLSAQDRRIFLGGMAERDAFAAVQAAGRSAGKKDLKAADLAPFVSRLDEDDLAAARAAAKKGMGALLDDACAKAEISGPSKKAAKTKRGRGALGALVLAAWGFEGPLDGIFGHNRQTEDDGRTAAEFEAVAARERVEEAEKEAEAAPPRTEKKERSEASVDSEPSMEEILAGIRRILSEDERADRRKRAENRRPKRTEGPTDEALMREWAAMAGGDEDEEAGEEDDDGSMAAEWEAMLGAGPSEEPDGTTRALNQDEIETLLGFHAGNGGNGIEAILNMGMGGGLVSYERLPMMEIVAVRLAEHLSKRLRAHFGIGVEVSLDNILSLRFGDYLNSLPLPSMLCVLDAGGWDGKAMAAVDSSFVYSTVDLLLGGRRGTTARIEGRPYTEVEKSLVGGAADEICGALDEAFAPVAPSSFRRERIETNPRFACFTRAADAAIVLKLRVEMEDRGGRIEILLPYSTIEPARERLSEANLGGKFGRDRVWEAHMAEQVSLAEIRIEASLKGPDVSLEEILGWKAGTRIDLEASVDAPVEILAQGKNVGSGEIGRRGNRLAVGISALRRTEKEKRP